MTVVKLVRFGAMDRVGIVSIDAKPAKALGAELRAGTVLSAGICIQEFSGPAT